MNILSLLLFLTVPLFALDPGSLRIKMYGAWMSKSPYCTSPKPIFNSGSPSEANYLDFIGKPELGSLDNTSNTYDGTYQCIIVKMSETLLFSPSATAGYCSAGVQYTKKLCDAGVTTVDPDTALTSTCSGSDNSDDTVFLYLSTGSTAATFTSSTNPFLPPSAAQTTNGLNLSSAWVINGAYTTNFVVNAYDKIASSASTCSLDMPTFGFTQVPQ